AVDLGVVRGVVAQPTHPERAKLTVDVGTPEGRALSVLLGGPQLPGVAPSDLGYALERLCGQLGRPLGGSGRAGIRRGSLPAAGAGVVRGVVAHPTHPERAKLTVAVGTPEGRALSVLLGGPQLPGVAPSDLGYALERLCGQLGRPLGGSGLSGIRSDFLSAA